VLREFIGANRGEILARTRAKVAARPAPPRTDHELQNGVPVFLDQLLEALRLAGPPSAQSIGAIGTSAILHGGDMLRMGFTVGQLVRGYGDICQAVTELADETDAPITVDEFHTLNRCLDDATAEAVTEYTRLREHSLAEAETERSGVLAHELRNSVSAASLAFQILQKGNIAINGSVGAVLARSLRRLSTLIDRSFVEARLDSGNEYRERVALSELVETAAVDGQLEAESRHLALCVPAVDGALYVHVDAHILAGAVANLLDNAFKFTHRGGCVSLTTSASATRILIEVEDQCGGLPPGKAEELFEAFEQRGADRSGLGLGLFISRKAVEACGGVLRVRDVAGAGCVFTIDLPRLSTA
jgi:signal transduction histidine kinase